MGVVETRRRQLETELDRIVGILVREYRAQAIYVFGSLARGAVTETSDLDLVVVKETDARWLDRAKEVLLLTRPRVGVDVFVFTPEEWERARVDDPFFAREVAGPGRQVHGTH